MQRQATRTSGRKTTKAEDALTMLEQDHRQVQKMFKQFEKLDRADETACRELVETACQALETHTTLEEEIFYPAVREAIEETDVMDEAEVEHDSAKSLIEQLHELEPSDPRYAAVFTVLGEYVNHHIEEEEKEMFKQAKRAKLDMEALGEQMKSRKMELEGGAGDEEDEEDEGNEEATATAAASRRQR